MAHSIQTSAPATAGAATKQPTARTGRSKSTYPYWFLVPGGLIFALFFLVPSGIAFYFSLTRWTLFDQEFIGLDNYRQFFAEPALVSGLTHTLIYAAVTSGLKVVLGMALAVLLTGPIIGRGFMRSVAFFPVLVSTIGIGLTFQVLMHPTEGVINQALGVVGISGPAWLVDPQWALLSVAFVDVWQGVGLATVIYMAGILSIPGEYFEAAEVRRSQRVAALPQHHAPARHARDDVGRHPVAHRRTAEVRPDLGDDQGRPGLHLRRVGVGRLQAVPGRLLRAVDRGQRRVVPARRRRSCCRCSGSSTGRMRAS